MARLSQSNEDLGKGILWMPVMVCPKCSKESTVTNVCRQCPEMPAIEAVNPDVVKVNLPCWNPACMGEQHTVQLDGKTYPARHGSVNMVYSGVVEEPPATYIKSGRQLPERKAYMPKDGQEAMRLWSGWGVVFEGDE